MKLLITGGCGFLGSNFAEHAIKNGHKVTVFDDLSRKGASLNLQWLKTAGKFNFVRGDIRSAAKVLSTVKGFKPDVVFHLAGQVAATTSIAKPRLDFEINSLGTLNLLEAIRSHCPDAAVLYSSTNKIYGALEQYRYRAKASRYVCLDKPNGFSEKTPLNFYSFYGCSKGVADQYMLDYARIFGLNTIVFRHSAIYGERQFATYDQGWIGWFCQKALEKKSGNSKPFTIHGTGKQVRDVLNVEDVKRLYFHAVEKAHKIRGQAFNIGGGMSNSLSLLELFELLEELIGVKLNYKRLPPREGDQKVFVTDIGKARSLIGWKPEVHKIDGIKTMLDWLRSEGDIINK